MVVCGYIGRYLAIEKGRDKTEGMLFGAFLGVIGLLIIALLPTKNLQPSKELTEEEKKRLEEAKLKAQDWHNNFPAWVTWTALSALLFFELYYLLVKLCDLL